MSSEIFKDNLLKGQTVFITGASSGINKGIAERFAEHGANIVVIARDPKKLELACSEIQSKGDGKCIGLVSDVRDYPSMEKCAAKAAEKFGKIDIVIAGAAGNFLAPAEEMSANAFSAVIDIDLKGTYHTFRACYQHLNSRARLIAISAPQAQQPQCLQSHVCSAKAGVEMLVKTLAKEWGGIEGARVNALVPGYVEGTVGIDVMSGAGNSDGSNVINDLCIPKSITAKEMGDIALMMVSPAASFMTGHVLAYDGGIAVGTTERLQIPDRL